MLKWKMVKKAFLICCLMFVLVPLVSALNLCEEVVSPSVGCRMLTPPLNCSGTQSYSITNLSGKVLETGNLTLLNNSIYYFTFNQSVGGYIVKLCDFRTREVYVREEGNSMWLAIIISLLGMTFLFGFIAFNISNPALKGVKALLVLLAVVNTFMLGFLPFAITLNPSDPAKFSPVAIGYFTVNGLLLVFTIWLYSLHLVKNVWKGGGSDE